VGFYPFRGPDAPLALALIVPRVRLIDDRKPHFAYRAQNDLLRAPLIPDLFPVTREQRRRVYRQGASESPATNRKPDSDGVASGSKLMFCSFSNEKTGHTDSTALAGVRLI
jgi:hypothetical protein